jgi:penicillin amidase
MRPVSGSDGLHEWVGRIPYDQLPHLEDPADGLIVSANNAVVDGGYTGFIARDWDPGYRAQRILDVLHEKTANGARISVADFQALQLDTYVGRAPLIAPYFSDASPKTADGRTVLSRMGAWNGRCDVDSPGCTAYMVAEYELERLLFDDLLGSALARDYVGSAPSWQRLVALMPELARTKGDLLASALDRAGADLRGALGSDSGWTWGRLHRIRFAEDTLGTSGIGPLEWYFDSGPFPVAGAAGAVNNEYYRFRRAYPDPTDPRYRPTGLVDTFSVTNGPSYREIFDLGKLDAGRIVQTTGNSGNPFDAHYGDLIDDWLAGRLIPLPFSRGAVMAATVATLNLVP